MRNVCRLVLLVSDACSNSKDISFQGMWGLALLTHTALFFGSSVIPSPSAWRSTCLGLSPPEETPFVTGATERWRFTREETVAITIRIASWCGLFLHLTLRDDQIGLKKDMVELDDSAGRKVLEVPVLW